MARQSLISLLVEDIIDPYLHKFPTDDPYEIASTYKPHLCYENIEFMYDLNYFIKQPALLSVAIIIH